MIIHLSDLLNLNSLSKTELLLLQCYHVDLNKRYQIIKVKHIVKQNNFENIPHYFEVQRATIIYIS